LLHTFEKRTKKIPEKELKIAKDRMRNDRKKKEISYD